MIPDEIKQSLIDIVHQETWRTASLTTAAILAGGAFIIFLAKNWLLNWVQNKVSHGFDQQLEAYKAELQEKAADYQNQLQQKFEMFRTITSQIQDRRTRSNEKEYDAGIKVWNALNNAHLKVLNILNKNKIIDGIQKEKPEYQIEYLRLHKISPHIIQQFQELNEKYGENEIKFFYLRKIIVRFEIERAEQIIDVSEGIFNNNSIFLNEELENLCSKFFKILLRITSLEDEILYNPGVTREIYIEKYAKESIVIKKEILTKLRSSLHIRPVTIEDK